GSSRPIRRSVKLGLKSEMSYSEAERKLSEILREINSPDHRPHSSVTLTEFWLRYQELVFPIRKYSTKKDMIGELSRHVLPELGARPLKNLNREALQMF